MTNSSGYVFTDGYTPVKGETTMITIKELDPGVILECTKPNGERYRYSISTWPPGDGGAGARGRGLKVEEVKGMRLIDADKLERQEFDGNEYCFDYVDAEDIDNAPTVDAVPVVRCRDCRKFKTYGCRMVASGFDDFCSYGERKDTEDAEG